VLDARTLIGLNTRVRVKKQKHRSGMLLELVDNVLYVFPTLTFLERLVYHHDAPSRGSAEAFYVSQIGEMVPDSFWYGYLPMAVPQFQLPVILVPAIRNLNDRGQVEALRQI